VRAAGVPVSGRKRVATFIAAISTWCWKGATLDGVETNGQAAVLIVRDDVPIRLTMDVSAQGITEITWFLRPSKLAAISQPGQRVDMHYYPQDQRPAEPF
jgi:RNA polymerase sigma-70 factor, ECF subfamily